MHGHNDHAEHANDPGANARSDPSPGPFAPPALPPPVPDTEPAELLRLAVVVKRHSPRVFTAIVERDDETGTRLAGCRASDPRAAIAGATAAALEVLRSPLPRNGANR